MPVDPGQVKFDPYQSTVPLVQIPPQEMDAGSRPAPPLPGQFGKKGTGALAIGDSMVKGFLQGHAMLAEKKYKQATATIAAADRSTEDAYQQYQESLSGGKDPVAAQAAYKNYVDTFNKAKEAKAQFVLPEKPAKGQKKDSKGKTQEGGGGGGFGAGIKDFLSANPHIVPQIALMTMQPKPPGQSREGKEADLRTQALEGQVKLGQTELAGEQQRQKAAAEAEKRADQQRMVEGAGGVDAVLNDKKADPQLQQTARQMKFSQLDAQSPEGKIKTGLMNDVLSGGDKQWTPQQRTLAGAMGVAPMPSEQTVTGKNGHQQMILVDPTTNQPIPGSKTLDLGPPAWASQFYAERAARHADVKKAVEGNPEAYGVTPNPDPKAMKASIDAKIAELTVSAEFGIKSIAGSTGKTGYEVQRDNTYLTDVVKAAGLNAKEGASPLDTGQAVMSYPVDAGGKKAGQPFAVGRDYFSKILSQFTTPPAEGGGVRAFRSDTPLPGVRSTSNPDGKSAEVLEAERRFMYGWVKNQMVNAKGKAGVSPEQADKILGTTALGRTMISGNMTRPPEQTTASAKQPTGGLTRPPSGPTKMYTVAGADGAYELTEEEVKKARAANIPLEEISNLNQ